jgi:hypothetical protein
MQKSVAAQSHALKVLFGRFFALVVVCCSLLTVHAYAGGPVAQVVGGSPTPPTAVMNLSGSSFYAGSSVTLAATINPGKNAEGIADTVTSVKYYVNSSLVGTATSSPYSLSWSASTVGSYTVYAVVTNSELYTGTSSTVSFSVIPVQPTISLSGPANGSSYNAPAALPLTVSVTGGTYPISSVNYYNGTTLLGSGSSTNGWALTTAGLYAGTYAINAKVTTSGSTTATSATNTVTVVTVPPSISLTAPTNNATYTSPAVETFTATASGGSYAISSVGYYNGSTLLGTGSTTSPYTFTTTLAPGTYNITAKVTTSGSTTATTSANAITVYTPPTISWSTPASASTYPSNVPIPMTVAVTGGSFSVQSVSYYRRL